MARSLTGSKWLATAMICCIGFVGGGIAGAVAQNRPYWTAVPSGGFSQECAGIVVTGNNSGLGLIPKRSSYLEVEYSSAGWNSCNVWLGRPVNWLAAAAQSKNINGAVCNNLVRYNTTVVATLVSGSVAPCSGQQGLTYYIFGEVVYLNPSAGNPGTNIQVPYLS
jgi:hypothetical protein